MYPKIEIVLYNPEWPEWFKQLKLRLEKCLGELITDVEHIGSTAIPGLGSKNRIDIQVSIREISDHFKRLLDEALILGGFQKSEFFTDHRPSGETSPDSEWQKFFVSGENAHPHFHFNIHFRKPGSGNHEYALVFRDYLRGHVEVARAYQVLKERIALYCPDQIQAYVEIKDPVCDIILAAARDSKL